MRILQINNYHYIKGGSDRVYIDTSSLLSEMGHSVANFSVNEPDSLENEFKEYFIRAIDFNNQNIMSNMLNSFRFMYSREANNKLKSLIADFKPQIAHLHIFYSRLTSSILNVLKGCGIPAVMTVHEYKILCPVYSFVDSHGRICEKCANGGYFNCFLKKCCKNSRAFSLIQAMESYIRDILYSYEKNIRCFIMPSRFIMQKHLQYRKTMVGKCLLLNNFLDIERFKFANERGNYYIYAGRLSREKGLMTLFQSFKGFPQLRLKIAGHGPLYKILESIKEKENIENIELLGYLKGDDLRNAVSNAGFLVIPSEWYENNPMSLVEAMASGKPAIGADIGGIPEIIQDGINGFLFRSGDMDSLRNVIKKSAGISQTEYGLLSKNARRTAEDKYNKDLYYNGLIDCYKSVLSEIRTGV